MMQRKFKIFTLILLQLLILNVLFTYRYSTLEKEGKNELWKKGELGQNPLTYLKLYFSPIVDEAYYYEWGTLVLGKTFETDYRAPEERYANLKPYFQEPPHYRIPYRDIIFEYPPLMVLPILTARVFSNSYLQFTKVLALILSMIYLGSLFIAYRIWQHLSVDEKISFPDILTLSALSLLTLGQLYVARLDLFPTLLFLLALYTFYKEKYYQATLWIVLGSLSKAYPLILAPLFIMILMIQKKNRTALFCTLLATVLLLFTNFGLGWITQGHYWESILYHKNRGIQIESLYALVPFLTHWLFNVPIFIYDGYGSTNLKMPHIQWLISFSSLLTLFLFTIIYFICWKKFSISKEKKVSLSLLIQASLLLIFTFILTFKVLSPQFLIWLTPLIFLLKPSRKLFFIIFLLTLTLSQLIFPNFYFLLENGHPFAVTLLFIRNIFLLILFGCLMRDFLKNNSQKKEIFLKTKPTIFPVPL